MILVLVLICCVGASPITTPARRTERFLGLLSCPRDIEMICATGKKRFVVHSSLRWVGLLPGCEFDEPIMVTALRECKDDSVPELCKDKWEKNPTNNCSSPVLKEIVDYLFQGACFLHDLCYLSQITRKNDCDVWFLHNMNKICSIRKATRAPCNLGANVVYFAVSRYGQCNFDKAKSWTKRNCTECPRNIEMICPTKKKHFFVHSSWDGLDCNFDEPIMVTALRDCNNSVMDVCKDTWVEQPNNCSAPVFKEVIDNAFQGACFLHDLCYLSWNTTQEDCDDWFLHNMEQTCSIQPKCPTFSLCNTAASTVHLAVKKFGRDKFNDAKNWTKENCTTENRPTKAPTENRPTKAPTSEGSGSRKGLGSGSGSGRPVQPNEQSSEQTELDEQTDEKSPKPEQTEPKRSPKNKQRSPKNKQLDN